MVEDKKSIQLKDLTPVSHGLAGPGEEARGEPRPGSLGQGRLGMGETIPGDFLSVPPPPRAMS